MPAGLDAHDPDVRIAAVARGLSEHACVGGWAAARLHEAASAVDDLRVFDGHGVWDRGPGRTPLARVLVCAPGEARISHRRDARVFRSVVP
ncbi:hypothetical protein ACQUZK_09690, partial [Streptococcus pyogenes]|uniref:hypothetical protein n=1 Tax=Streptococcus pyogenes TaxID=1314 RepID=UPI003DA14D8C